MCVGVIILFLLIWDAIKLNIDAGPKQHSLNFMKSMVSSSIYLTAVISSEGASIVGYFKES